ncbi:PhnB protein, partial [mine drainage metagenome]
GDTPMKPQYPPEEHQKVIYAHLKSGAIEFSATDWLHRTRRPRQGNTVAMYVTGGSLPELRAIFDKLSAGGDPALLDDFRKLPFGIYGHLADKYGVHWFFQGEAGSD